ncbi:uncharacterized protein LOC127745493 [Arachis duranensis]|uniref:Uncharacterized protein LOC127745493 n=1 Tax=Arachis duranensis TaxID=130453 RepID=A0A9C6TCU9_ARADU|nr:uncharacterized protein LOC127745493 [Arachis duranensis]
MVITIILANAILYRTLVDQGSSADILFKTTFDELDLEEKELRAYLNSLFGLGDTPIQPLGYISLDTTFGKGNWSRTLNIDYIVVDVSSAYNALIGQTTLNQLGAVVSTPHLCMDFPTTEGIAMIKGDHKIVCRCYNESLNLRGKWEEIHTIELGGIRGWEELRPQPEGETEKVQIGYFPDKTTNIGATYQRLMNKVFTDNIGKLMEAHTIKVQTNQSIKGILQKTDLAGRILQCAVELSEFDLQYKARTAIKLQYLADFVAKYTDTPEIPTKWNLYMDGSSNKTGSGAGVIIESNQGTQIELSLKFEFPTSNN